LVYFLLKLKMHNHFTGYIVSLY